MQNEFDKMAEYVLGFEGKYSNNKNDKGGETKWGISKKAFSTFNISTLTRDQAKQIYFDYFYTPNKHLFDAVNDNIYSTGLKIELFDSIVNMGQGNALTVFQQALNVLRTKKLVEDGVAGALTKAAWQELNGNCSILYVFRSERAGYYRVLAAKDPSQKDFLDGWLKRAYAIQS